MSSTNRSNARDEHISDYYVTPIKDVELFLKEFDKTVKLNWSSIKILDPCAGGNEEIRDDGGIKEVYHPMSYPVAIKNIFGDCHIDTFDIRKDSLAVNKCNYLRTKLTYKPNIIITNPPFNQAIPIIEKALNDVADDGYVIMLLRLNFFGSKDRKPFFEKYMPEYCFMHHIRIGFVDKKDENGYVLFDKDGKPKRGSTDSIEYAHYVWHKGHYPEFAKIKVI
jgi:hypothetical protein